MWRTMILMIVLMTRMSHQTIFKLIRPSAVVTYLFSVIHVMLLSYLPSIMFMELFYGVTNTCWKHFLDLDLDRNLGH